MNRTMYAIPNCDTVKKARTWLAEHGVDYAFHDYKKQGVDEAALRRWVGRLGWEVVLNRAGQTFRALPDTDKTDLDAEKAIAIMLAKPSAIKRPILEAGSEKDGVLLAGFKPDTYLAALKP
ncbi:Spx/MgsR family transcriptional regulator [Sphingomonas sp. BE270]|uniref:arsenate reductase n=2 Tax=Sphingomonas TaxID=13687 RepID=UPI000A913F04|nr:MULTISPECIES: arsenate reductase [unclassified Sphingomonas]MDR6847606.1 Spx/MgsR family transcriptional regulator [Sphingomonas sp. BE137]MDR7257638.1 Spx/MgsR family transcriptional regulator [Sphingomonas sp. BE270]